MNALAVLIHGFFAVRSAVGIFKFEVVRICKEYVCGIHVFVFKRDFEIYGIAVQNIIRCDVWFGSIRRA